ncbi:DNA internalization-related competence protein ComEC/Rec2 [Geomonas sp. RF6]|uniref:DNA internalization-related competence protein ComEC/Rec2 n=1 Tax=Geomonas sp. RF6 TaxID=2897342 RepID=UPI001E43CBF3|nr:DNA internalization-related competence protein ComEC/Rec2 [Geomonas sp. RF6]UFS69261.1 DNA internalization-related competence protein ComEC/Rec2 [Geomonas sp. RF6]
MRAPLFLPLLCAIAGICCAGLFGISAPLWALCAFLSCLLCASWCPHRLPFLVGIAAVSFVWGSLSVEEFLHRDPEWQRHASEKPHLVEGVLASRPEESGGATRLYLRDPVLWSDEEGSVAMQGRLLLYVREGRVRFRSGDRVRFSSRVSVPRSYGLPGESDYPGYLALKGVQGVCFVRRGEEVLLVSREGGWRANLDALAARLGAFIEETVPGVEGGILKALLIGDCSGVSPEIQDAYARSGVNHILSISGFHVGILCLCLFHVLFRVARLSETVTLRLNLRRALLLAALPVTVLYLFLSGCAAATVRSLLMIASLTVALYLKRETDPVNVVTLAACAIIAVAPATLFDVSFQLSFLAVWGLAVLTPFFLPRGEGIKGWRPLFLSVGASLAAILSTAVPAAYHFHRISLAGLICNLVVVPLVGYGSVVLGFASLVSFFLFLPLARLLMVVAGHLVGFADRAVLYFATFPVLEYQPDRLDFALSLLAMCALTFIAPRRIALACTVTLCIVLLWRGAPHAVQGDGRVHALFLSVGQGDAALLRLPDGKTMLVDGGGSFGEGDTRVGERLLVPALLALKVRRIDYLVLSHPHPDHQQGLLPVAARWEVGEFWESGVPCGGREYQQLRWVLASREVPRRVLRGGMAPLLAGGATVEPLWPPPDPEAEGWDENDTSLVLRVRCGKSALLLTGDVGGKAEEELVARGAPLCCTLLKVPHHGSSHSAGDGFLAACAPRVAVVSAGFGNAFHLPAPSTLGRLARHGIDVRRTDLQGSVEAVLAPDGSWAAGTPWEGHFN